MFPMIFRRGTAIAAAAALLIATGCTMKKQEAPALTGPSELGTSIVVSVSPDILQQDGASQSLVTVTARDGAGQPLRNIALRAEIQVNGVLADFGTLSARSLVTDANGKASLTYTAPAAPPIGTDNGTIVNIIVTPVGTDAGNQYPRSASIRLVPPGVVAPPAGLNPNFTFTPTSPLEGQVVYFQACMDAANPCAPAGNPIVSYTWDLANGRTGSGQTVTRTFGGPGTYLVTLTVTDAYGRSASTQQIVTVAADTSAVPTPDFTVNPSAPRSGQTITFSALATATPGHSIVSYSWTFDDGTSATGNPVTHSYVVTVATTYTVRLIVTDDRGKTATTSRTVTVTP